MKEWPPRLEGLLYPIAGPRAERNSLYPTRIGEENNIICGMNPSASFPTDQGFPKSERLSGKTEIAELFEKGSFFYLKPFKVYFISGENPSTPKVLISIPKSRFGRSTERNLLKRRTREAYRLSKGSIIHRLSEIGINLKKLGFVYVEDRLFSFAYLKERMERIPDSIKQSIGKKNG